MGTGLNGGDGQESGPRRLRASDRDRAEAVAVLRQATADGYLTLVEFEDRLDAAFSARYLDELDGLLADLPRPVRAPAGGSRTAPRPGWIPAAVPRVARICLRVLAAMLILAAVMNFWIPLTVMGFLWWRRNHHRGFHGGFGCGRRHSLEFI